MDSGSGAGEYPPDHVTAILLAHPRDGPAGAHAPLPSPDPGDRVAHPRSFETWDAGRFVEEAGGEYREYLARLCGGDLRRPLHNNFDWQACLDSGPAE